VSYRLHQFRNVMGLALVLSVCGGQAWSAEPDEANLRLRGWKTERLELKSGRVLEGFVAGRTEDEIEFVEIVRRPAEPMFLVVRPLAINSVQAYERLSPAERKRLAERIARFRNRALIEAGREEDVDVEQAMRRGKELSVYRGPWFELHATLRPPVARKCVVRLEQMFRAFRQVLPPRDDSSLSERKRPLQVFLYGTMSGYRTELLRRDITASSAAVYVIDEHAILAGTELGRFIERLGEVEQEHDMLRAKWDVRKSDLSRRLAVLRRQLDDAEVPAAQASAELKAARRAFHDQYRAVTLRLDAAQRANERKLTEVMQRMLRRLYHEAFHAYLASHVFSGEDRRVPLWLNEGLAQVFERGQLDGDALRIDAPRPDYAKQLAARLYGDNALALRQLLTAPRRAFLMRHRRQDARAQELYLFAWGLTYYLLFDENGAGTSIDDLVIKDDAQAAASDPDAVKRFEQAVGTPLKKFEKRWQAAMTKLGRE